MTGSRGHASGDRLPLNTWLGVGAIHSMRVLTRALWAVLATGGLLWSPPVWGQQVVLVQPAETDPILTEAFNRLRGELTMHGLELSVSHDAVEASPAELAALADEDGAVASVAFTQNKKEPAVVIWIGNPTAGKPIARMISTRRNAQAASILALRAVEYLRVNLRDFGGSEHDTVASDGESADVALPPDLESEVEPESPAEEPARWFFHGGISALVNRPDAHLAVGPSMVGIGLQPRQWVAMRVMFAAPLFGTRSLAGDTGDRATLYFLLGTGELTLEALLGGKVRLAVGGASGVSYVGIDGATGVIEPSRTVAAVGPTSGVSLVASPHTELRLDAQCLWLTPTATATVGRNELVLGQPVLALRLGVVIRP